MKLEADQLEQMEVDSPTLVEPCPRALSQRAQLALDTIAEKLSDADPEAKITTATCDREAVCWNWALYGGANAREDDPREYLDSEYKKKPKDNPAARRGDSNPKKINAVRAWRGFQDDSESQLSLVVYAMRGDKGNFPHWELRWANSDGEGYITLTKGLDEDLKAFNGDSVVPGTSALTTKVSVESLSEAHVLALEDLAKNPVVA